MSQEFNNQSANNPGQNPQQPSQPASTYRPAGSTPPAGRPQNSNTWIYLAVIAVLLGACIYLFMSRKNTIQEVVQVTGQRDSAITTRDNLNTEYEAAIVR